jgi:mannitol-specific phosphotransferase system IIBC component
MEQSSRSRQNTLVIFLMAAVLVWGCITAVTIPAGEFPPSPYHLFMMGLDAVMTLLLATLVMAERGVPGSARKSAAMLLGGIGVLAGVAQVLIRFTSDHAWWTGHYAPPVFN